MGGCRRQTVSFSLCLRGSKLSPKPPGKRAKEDRRWDGKVSSEEAAALNYSSAPPIGSQGNADSVTSGEFNPDVSVDVLMLFASLVLDRGLVTMYNVCIMYVCAAQMSMVGQMRGQLQPLDSDPSPLTSEPPSGSKPTSKSSR